MEWGVDSLMGKRNCAWHHLDGVFEANRLGEVLALLFRDVDRGVGTLLGGDRLALCLGNLRNLVTWGHPLQ